MVAPLPRRVSTVAPLPSPGRKEELRLLLGARVPAMLPFELAGSRRWHCRRPPLRWLFNVSPRKASIRGPAYPGLVLGRRSLPPPSPVGSVAGGLIVRITPTCWRLMCWTTFHRRTSRDAPNERPTNDRCCTSSIAPSASTHTRPFGSSPTARRPRQSPSLPVRARLGPSLCLSNRRDRPPARPPCRPGRRKQDRQAAAAGAAAEAEAAAEELTSRGNSISGLASSFVQQAALLASLSLPLPRSLRAGLYSAPRPRPRIPTAPRTGPPPQQRRTTAGGESSARSPANGENTILLRRAPCAAAVLNGRHEVAHGGGALLAVA
jgi:hypothetical protein